MKKSLSSYFLFFLVLLQAISAIPAGLSLIFDPSGKSIGLPIEMLEPSPFRNFFIPGVFLFVVLGIFPIITFYGLLRKNKSKLAEKINLYKEYHWSWTFSYYLGLLLILWINMQLFFIRDFGMLHFIYSMLGVLIILITHLPNTKRDYKLYSY